LLKIKLSIAAQAHKISICVDTVLWYAIETGSVSAKVADPDPE
jgi:hypothetical protein